MRPHLVCLAFALAGCGGIAVIDPGDSPAPSAGSGSGGDTTAGGSASGGEAPCVGELCGACDHDCLGGACVDGRCQPVVIGSGFKATDLVLDGERLFATSVTGEVHAGPRLGVIEPWSTGDDQAFALMTYGDDVVWTGNGSLWRADKATGQSTQLAQHGKRSFDVGGDGGVLYADYDGFTGVWQLPSGESEPRHLALDFFAHGFLVQHGVKDWSRLFYFADAGLVALYLTPEVERTVLLAPSEEGMFHPIVLASGQEGFLWTEGLAVEYGGGLYRWSGEGSPELVASIEVPVGLALREDGGPDGTSPVAFVTAYAGLGDSLDGVLYQVDRSTGETLVLAEGLYDPYNVTADAQAIYWIEQDEARAVMRLAR